MSSRSLTSRIAVNSVVQLGGKVATFSISLILVILLTRNLGLQGYGDYVTALTISQLFAIIADLGVNMYVLKRLSTKTDQDQTILGSAVGLRLVSLGVLLIPAALIALILPYSEIVRWGILVALVSVTVQVLNSLFVTVLQARLEMRYPASTEVVGRLINLLLAFVFLMYSRSILAVLAAQVIGSCVNLALTYYYSQRYVRPSKLWQPADWRLTLRESIPISISTVLGYLYFKIDTVMLSLIPIIGRENRVEVGIYGAAYKILDILIFIPHIFLGSIFPVLSDFLHQKDARVNHLVDRAAVSMLYMGLVVGCGLVLFAEPIIAVLAGSEFAPAALPLRILGVAICINFVATVFTYTSLALNKQTSLIWVYSIAGIVNIVLNSIFIPNYSYVAAAWVTVITESIVASGVLIICLRGYAFKLNWMKYATTAAAMVCLYVITMYLHFLPWTVLAVIYCIGAIAVSEFAGVFTRGDLRNMLQRRSGIPESGMG